MPETPVPDCEARGRGSVARMRLLWRSAYLGEVATHLGSGAAAAVQSVGLSPASDNHFSFETAGALLTAGTVDSLTTAADTIAVWALSTDATATSVFGCNATTVTGTAAETCFANFLSAKGERLLRREMSPAELAESMAFFKAQVLEGQSDGAREGFRQGLASLLLHPDFLFLRDSPAGLSSQLDAFSSASRLSFALTGRGPDEALFAAARNGTLTTPTVFESEATRLLESPEAKVRARTFFREWLGYDGWSVSYSPAFLAGFDPTTLEADAVAEVDGFVDQLLWQERAGAAALLTSRATVPLPSSLAQIYGTAPGATLLPENRAGLLTRVGLLASGTDDWHVVGRGLAVVQKMLCFEIPPPAVDVAAAAREAEGLRVSNAARIAAVTSSVSCSGCHKLINPAGSARSDYDALGRAVSNEKHFAGGVFDFEVPVVATADVSALLGRPGVTINGSVALSSELAASANYQRCFTTQFVRGAMGRADSSDACLAFDGAAELARGGSMVDAMRAVVRSPDFLIWKE